MESPLLPANASQGISSTEISLVGGPLEEPNALLGYPAYKYRTTPELQSSRAAKTIYERQRGNRVKEMHTPYIAMRSEEGEEGACGLQTDEREFRSRALCCQSAALSVT